jgi:hypothetical protein
LEKKNNFDYEEEDKKREREIMKMEKNNFDL